MRHALNVVSGGILLGLSLLAIAILTALYATAWQAATIFSVLTGIFVSVSLYFGSHTEIRTAVKNRDQALEHAADLTRRLGEAKAESEELTASLRQAIERLSDLERELAQKEQLLLALLLSDLLLNLRVVVAIDVEAEDDPPLFI